MNSSDPCDVSADHARQFRETIGRDEFPCVGAKSAVAQGRLSFVRARDVTSAWNDLQIHRDLVEWSARWRDNPAGFRSFAVVFDGPDGITEQDFEAALWERLQSLANKDHWLGQSYAAAVSPDPEDPHFCLSFGGEAFFVVGLHANSSRPARRFAHPAIVFNPHAQFERLRQQGRFARMRERIMARDIALAGMPNPMLADHGNASAARQFSGRAVGPDWACPFRDPRA